jgi:erythromycin esterase-like protein
MTIFAASEDFSSSSLSASLDVFFAVQSLLDHSAVAEYVEHERHVLCYAAEGFMQAFGVVRGIVEFLRGLDDGYDGADEADDGDCFGARHRESPVTSYPVTDQKREENVRCSPDLFSSTCDETGGYSTSSIGRRSLYVGRG